MSQELSKVAPITQTVNVNGMKVTFEIDSGCGVTIVSKKKKTVHAAVEENIYQN